MLNVCDTGYEFLNDVCDMDLVCIIASVLCIVIFACGIVFLAVFCNKIIYDDLLHLHNLRSSLTIALLLINSCEVAESLVAFNPPANYKVSPLALANTTLAFISTIVLTAMIRVIEVRLKVGWMYLVIFTEALQFIVKLCKLVRMGALAAVTTSSVNGRHQQTPPLLTDGAAHFQSLLLTLSASVLLLLVVVDAFTVYKEHIPTKPNHLSDNVGYNHPMATFLSKVTFWWLTPLLWRGYFEPLEHEDLGTLREEDTSRSHYDRFLLVYQNSKKTITSLWWCYFKVYWKLFLSGGILKLFGDFAALVGPLSISQIIEYVEQKNSTTDGVNETVITTSVAADTTSTVVVEYELYFPTCAQVFSNGWIMAIAVLISSIAQGSLSQASTHMVNMVGIRLKTSIQGLIYRKTLLISSSCFYRDERGSSVDELDGHITESQHSQRKSNLISTGAITNLMSEDALNVMTFFWIAHYVWAIPLKIGVVMYFLYQKLGISAIIGAMVCIATMTPLQFLIGKYMSANGKKASEHTDNRLRKINEVLLGIRLIKLNAWENVFKEKIENARNLELKHLDLDSFYWTLMTFLTHVSSVLVTFVTLAVFVNIEGGGLEFTASRVFSSLALFNQLTVPLFIFPITVPIIISAIVSTRRIGDFLNQPEVEKQFEGIRNMARILSRSDASLDVLEIDGGSDSDTKKTMSSLETVTSVPASIVEPAHDSLQQQQMTAVVAVVQPVIDNTRRGSQLTKSARVKLKKNNQISASTKCERNRYLRKKSSSARELQTIADDLVLSIKDGVFTWNQCESSVCMQIGALNIPKGKLTIVVGKSGSGKTSLLAALLQEMHTVSGFLMWNKYSTIAYVPQNPWLLNATIRENILFGESFRPKRYEKVLESCTLKPDIELMPEGDATEIGERGLNLSGGQRQRIAIARALYSCANVILMDDPLSSLDNEVAKWIFENSIKNALLGSKRTVILVTQKMNLLHSGDYIIAMEKNKVRACGTFAEIENNDASLTCEWNSLIARDNAKDGQLSPGRTARERWRLFKNIAKLGLQKVNTVDERQMLTSPNVYVPLKKRSTYGSRHLTYEMPLPIDECFNEEIEFRRRPSRRGRLINSMEMSESHKNVFRVNSLQYEQRNTVKVPVARIISSPTCMQEFSSNKSDSNFASKNVGFKEFLRRMSSRSKVTAHNVRNMKSLGSSNSVNIVEEENHAPAKRLISTISRNSDETDDEISSNVEEISKQLIYDEERKYGKIPTRIYLLYIKSCGWIVVSIFCLTALGWQALRICTDIWLQNWTNMELLTDDPQEVFKYFEVFGTLSGICILLSLISTPAGQFAGTHARRVLHKQLLGSMMGKSLHYFQTTPMGRIMNRFSNDMAVIDKKIASTTQRLLQFVLLCLCAVLINTAVTPWFIVLTIPISISYYLVQKFYRFSSRELQRIESITSSPIISHFSETIQGVTSIRAYNQESRFMKMLFKRMEANNIATVTLNTSNRWLGIALDYLGGVIVFIAIITALLTAHCYPETVTPSLVGLAINYTLLVPIYLNWVVKLLSDMEMYIGAVERIDIPIESDRLKQGNKIYKSVPISWPQRGDILFENVSMRYEDQKQNVISDLTLSIPAGQRIGICGRTGSGKSSLAMSLFGILEVTGGRVLIDDVDLSTIHTDEIRTRLSVIPQDAILFDGTIRENLDPRGHYTDLELWNCLETAQLRDAIALLPMGLDTGISEGGSNLSSGQKQLFCLARAVLRGSACLILDEATSSLDTVTEMALLEAANKAFQGRTVITIAHRVYTLLEYDRVIVLDAGQIVEDGNPRQLKRIADGKFAAMLKASSHTFT